MIYNVTEKYMTLHYHDGTIRLKYMCKCPNGVTDASIKMQKTKVRE